MVVQPDTIIRSDRKTLSVSIDPLGRLTVRAPKRCSEERIFAFLQEKEAWISKHKRQREGAGARLPSENLDGFTFLLLGKEHTVSLVSGAKIGYDGENLRLFVPRESSRERLVRWLKENAKRILREVTAQTARRMGVAYKSVSISSAKTRWGSCSGDNAVRYSFRLLYAPKEVLEYVVVHELAHTKHKNHSAAFWDEVKRYEPAYKQKRKWLKDNAILMEIF
ncbi:MAG: M48 family metallopeptidase [Clostridia bacterium]|nr:M48 family metallopeptidase [Clostridia bacterium]